MIGVVVLVVGGGVGWKLLQVHEILWCTTVWLFTLLYSAVTIDAC